MLKEVTISEALQAAQDGADVTVLISKGGGTRRPRASPDPSAGASGGLRLPDGSGSSEAGTEGPGTGAKTDGAEKETDRHRKDPGASQRRMEQRENSGRDEAAPDHGREIRQGSHRRGK